jgi:hypothetical protein
VLSFITQFGGGKTHTLAALWHLAGIGEPAALLPGVADLLARERLSSVPRARRAVFVGNAWDPHSGRPTPWHDIAFQLGGETAMAALGDTAPMTPPGTAALARLFAGVGAPVLVLMDEVLNFMNRHRALADAFYAFLDNLVRAATGTRHLAVVLSLPKSAVEMTGYEQDWQDRITKAVKRVARDLIANDEAELAEIVRRRLFEDLGSDGNRTEIAKTYADWCFERRTQLPPQWTSVDPTLTERGARRVLQDRFAACYPFHPATLSVFARKWQSLPQYQQTRGTLGMLAQWLSRLYAGHHTLQKDPLITLGSAPLDDRGFRATVLGQLGEPRLAAAIDADVTAATSHARALDADTKGLLKDLHCRVGIAMLFECAGGQTGNAAHLPELRFALGAPDLDTTSVDNAAAALESRSFFIRQVGADGYRIGQRAKLTKVVAEKRASLDEARDVLPETRRLARQVFEAGSPVPIVAFPPDGAAVRDTPRLSLVLADPTLEWDGSAELRDLLAEWTYRRGAEDRLFPASLIWCLRRPGSALAERVETALAWRAVRQDLAAALLADDTDPDEVRGIDASIRAAETDAREAVWGAYSILAFADRQAPGRMRVLDLGAGHSSSRETLAGRAIAALKTEALLNDTVGPGYVDRKWPTALVASGAWPLSGLRQSFLDGSLTRLFDPDAVLRSRIVEWVGSGQFGLATGEYRRIWFNELLPPEHVAFAADVYLLKPAVAEALRNSPVRPATQSIPTVAPVTISVRGSAPATLEVIAELAQILEKLGLADQLKIERE